MSYNSDFFSTIDHIFLIWLEQFVILFGCPFSRFCSFQPFRLCFVWLDSQLIGLQVPSMGWSPKLESCPFPVSVSHLSHMLVPMSGYSSLVWHESRESTLFHLILFSRVLDVSHWMGLLLKPVLWIYSNCFQTCMLCVIVILQGSHFLNYKDLSLPVWNFSKLFSDHFCYLLHYISNDVCISSCLCELEFNASRVEVETIFSSWIVLL